MGIVEEMKGKAVRMEEVEVTREVGRKGMEGEMVEERVVEKAGEGKVG